MLIREKYNLSTSMGKNKKKKKNFIVQVWLNKLFY